MKALLVERYEFSDWNTDEYGWIDWTMWMFSSKNASFPLKLTLVAPLFAKL